MQTVRPVITSNGVPYLQMGSVGSHSISGRENEGNRVGFKWEEIENNNVKIIITIVLVSVSCSPLHFILHSKLTNVCYWKKRYDVTEIDMKLPPETLA